MTAGFVIADSGMPAVSTRAGVCDRVHHITDLSEA
jgi:hypothetical protein